MGFFAEFNAWLNALLAGYIGDNTARIAAALEPAIVTLGVIYVMVWGYLQLTGQIEEPFIDGVKRIMTLAVISGRARSTSGSTTHSSSTPSSMRPASSARSSSVPTIRSESSIRSSSKAAMRRTCSSRRASLLNGNFAYYLAGIAVYLIVGLTAIYTIFLLSLSRIALSVLLALGPLFIALLLFESSKRFFEAWLAQLANYALITILTVLVAALMLRVVTVAAQQAVSEGGIDPDCERGAGLHGRGAHLSRHAPGHADGGGACERARALHLRRRQCRARLGLGSHRRGSGQFARGLTDRETESLRSACAAGSATSVRRARGAAATLGSLAR